jgi:DNA mismatch repair protein MutL
MIKKLSQEIINQIAAGEVVERPSSVVKELLDNAIDAQADKIDIKIKGGGIKYIEVSDNGVGIDTQDLPKSLEAHATSKINSIEDLNEVFSMGFRGEALSTIVSVAQVSITSKTKESEFGYQIKGEGVETTEIVKSPRDIGTSVVVENIFHNIPARLKYLRAESTEYKKVLEILAPYLLIYPNIHFTLFHNGKQIYNLPQIANTNSGEINNIRVQNVLKSDFTKDLLPVFFDGEGMKISGFVAQPKFNFSKTVHQYFFVNKRPVHDRGVFRAVSEGFSRFIPNGQRVPFILNLDIKPSLVDVNVHPRKEEVKFMNPFRVYTALEDAVKQALKKYSTQTVSESREFVLKDKSSRPREINYRKSSDYNVKSGLKFSEHLLQPKVEKHEKMDLFERVEKREDIRPMHQIFNKYIITEFEEEIWIIDQHAASERIFYEKVMKDFESKSIDVQNLLIPISIEFSDVEIEFLKENEMEIGKFGFKIDIQKNTLNVVEVPSILAHIDFEMFFKDLIESDTSKNVKEIQEDIISTIVCHASVRSGQKLHYEEMQDILSELKKCENATSCPHGRPIIWKLTIKDIDKNFYRT